MKSVALDMVRWLRARRLEAEYITSELHPPLLGPPIGDLRALLGEGEPEVLDPGLPARISAEAAHRLVGIFQRCESFSANRMFRTLHELERLQRMRQGEHLPAPATVDVSIHDGTAGGSTSAGGEWQKAPLMDGESLPTVDASSPAETETADSTGAALETWPAPPAE